MARAADHGTGDDARHLAVHPVATLASRAGRQRTSDHALCDRTAGRDRVRVAARRALAGGFLPMASSCCLPGRTRRQEEPLASPPGQHRCPAAWNHGRSGSAGFWSPDGRSVAFWSDRRLQRLDLATNVVQTICEGLVGFLGGGTWGPNDLIAVWSGAGADGSGPLMHLPATGGTLKPLTALDAGAKQTAHRNALVPPDGRRSCTNRCRTPPSGWARSMAGRRRNCSSPMPVCCLRHQTGCCLSGRTPCLRSALISAGCRCSASPSRSPKMSGRTRATADRPFTVSSNGILVYRTGDQTPGRRC